MEALYHYFTGAKNDKRLKEVSKAAMFCPLRKTHRHSCVFE